jgi:hypothetical protein
MNTGVRPPAGNGHQWGEPRVASSCGHFRRLVSQVLLSPLQLKASLVVIR